MGSSGDVREDSVAFTEGSCTIGKGVLSATRARAAGKLDPFKLGLVSPWSGGILEPPASVFTEVVLVLPPEILDGRDTGSRRRIVHQNCCVPTVVSLMKASTPLGPNNFTIRAISKVKVVTFPAVRDASH